MNDKRIMLLELGTGRQRPMRPNHPSFSSAPRAWDGFLVEEHRAARSQYADICLLNHVVYLELNEAATLEWRGGGSCVNKRIAPGQISILPANRPYSARVRGAGGCMIISLEHKLFSCAAAAQGILDPIEPGWVHGVEDSLLRELALALRNEARQEVDGTQAYAESLAAMLAAHVVRKYTACPNPNPGHQGGLSGPKLSRTIQFIQEHLGETLSLERMATHIELSSWHFARMFKATVGVTPHQYLREARIKRAKQLLLDHSTSIADAAHQAGFYDQSHLTRCFQEFVGLTPGGFVQAVGGRGK